MSKMDSVRKELSADVGKYGVSADEIIAIVASIVMEGAGWHPLVRVLSKIGRISTATEVAGGQKQESRAIRTGADILRPFLRHGMVTIGRRSRSIVLASYDASLADYAVKKKEVRYQDPHTPRLWSGKTSRSDRIPYIKAADPVALNSNLKGEIISVLNRLGSIPYKVDRRVFLLIKNHYESGNGPMRFFREKDPEKKMGLAFALGGLFKSVERYGFDRPVFLRWNYDFRGRVYPSDPFLNPHGQEHARALLRFYKPAPLGENGLMWLAIHTANVWGYDKLPIRERVKKVFDNLDYLSSIARNPIEDRSWWEADKPYMFYAACCEIDRFLKYQGDERNFQSDLICYIDGSQNGVQHLCALTRDEEIAPLVGLVPTERPGDLYSHISRIVWRMMEEEYRKLGSPDVLDEVLETEKRLNEKRDELQEEAKEFFSKKNKARLAAAYQFWLGVESGSIRRKAVKRPVMTLGYGATKYGMGDMVMEDLADVNEYIDKRTRFFSAVLGSMIYKACYNELGKVGLALNALRSVAEAFGDTHMSWRSPIDEFLVATRYCPKKRGIVNVRFDDVMLRLVYQYYDRDAVARRSQVRGAPPNIVHSMDAAHLREVVRRTISDVTVIHDSYGAHAGSMSGVLGAVSRVFVDLYKDLDINKLASMINDKAETNVPIGSLDISKVLESEYFFH